MLIYLKLAGAYVLFTALCRLFLPVCPESGLMKGVRKVHNLGLAMYSGVAFCVFAYEMVVQDKFASWDTLVCQPMVRNDPLRFGLVHFSMLAFFLSKFWEWLDTAFLICGNKKVSWLQYTHHMTTAPLVLANWHPKVSSLMPVTLLTNSFVHTPMYWYFAFPRGVLYPVRRWITRIQIVQHVLCLTAIGYAEYFRATCDVPLFGNRLGLAMYLMYLGFFVAFYVTDGRKKKKVA